ncbi:unnamed protein product [Sphagnum tenellum]
MRRACSKLESIDMDQELKQLMIDWARQDISVKSAKKKWADLVQKSELGPLFFLLNEQDRTQYARYLFTGTIFCQDQDAVRGNPLIVTGLSQANSRRDNFLVLADGYCLQEYKSSLMETIGEFYAEKAKILKDLILRQNVTCFFLHHRLTMNIQDDIVVALSIKALKPAVIEWSNVPDYFNPKLFTVFADVCSQPETLHTLHSMNWVKLTYGASLTDYAFLKDYDVGKMVETAKNFMEIDRRAEFKRHPYMAKIYSFEGISRLPLDLVEGVVARFFQMRFLEHFYGEGAPADQNIRLVKVDQQFHLNELLRRSNTQVHFVMGNRSGANNEELCKKYVQI